MNGQQKNIACPGIVIILLILSLLAGCTSGVSQWSPAEYTLATRWSKEVTPLNVWQEYPRPMLVRNDWLNLNGLWEYAITPLNDKHPDRWDGNILVPFPVESALSGVKKTVGDTCLLWYRKSVTIPPAWKGMRIFLHFEAVDWKTTVWVDHFEVGSHQGGYTPFDVELTRFVRAGKKHQITVSVWDPTDQGEQPRGKQVSRPGGIFYTSATGIWQTVWLEPLPHSFIQDITTIPDIDSGLIHLQCNINQGGEKDSLRVKITLDNEPVTEILCGSANTSIPVPDARLWSPEHPVLYDMQVQLLRDGQVMDEVRTCFGMRKISLGTDPAGYTRMMLNNEFIFQNGPLDQGFWPDGIYTPPCDEAMRHDVWMVKELGFNMLRKHVKVEPRRFYYWCDRLGVLVWQDMPSTSGFVRSGLPDLDVTEEHARQFEYELEQVISSRACHPSIIVWVPFNEGWGQYATGKIVDIIQRLDPSRLVNAASGWADRGVGHIMDIHNYPEPRMPQPERNRAVVLGEFGGLGLPVTNHVWQEENWGYRKMSSPDELLMRYEDFYASVWDYAGNGLSAAVYTQITDVETETNGLMTYDREVLKMDTGWINLANRGYLPPMLESEQRIFLDKMDVTFKKPVAGGMIFYSLDGSDPDLTSDRYTAPVTVSRNLTLKARVIWPDGHKSRIRAYRFNMVSPVPPVSTGTLRKGLKVKLYEGRWQSLPSFDTIPVTNEFVTHAITTDIAARDVSFGLLFHGYIRIPETGVYTFRLASDDGARLILNDSIIVDGDGIGRMSPLTGFCALADGIHKITIPYYQRSGGRGLHVEISGPGTGVKEIDPSWLFHE